MEDEGLSDEDAQGYVRGNIWASGGEENESTDTLKLAIGVKTLFEAGAFVKNHYYAHCRLILSRSSAGVPLIA
jgi:hypothetical protein